MTQHPTISRPAPNRGPNPGRWLFAGFTAAVALLMINFGHTDRSTQEARSWLKRIIITWIILNSLGFIMAYITPFFSGGQWTPS